MTTFDRICAESVQYRLLRDLFRLDPDISPRTARDMQEVFEMAGERKVTKSSRR